MDARKCTTIIMAALLIFCAAVSAESSLTICNQSFAVVRESLALNLQRGTNEVSVTLITAHLEPDSVILRDPQGKRALQILEQNYRADPISQGLLLSLYEGKEIDFLVQRGEGKEEIVRGKIIRSGYQPHQSGMQRYGSQYVQTQMARASSESAGQPIIEVNGKLRFSLPGQPLFPALADDTILKPTIRWVLETNQPGPLDAEFSYITGGMSWEADYRMLAQSKGEAIDENTIDHTPRDETVRVYTGDAFDLVGERRRTEYQIDTTRNWLDEAFEIKLRNRKDSGSVEIRVVEHLYRWINWQITDKSDPFTKTDSQTIEFRVQVPAGQEEVVTYKVHYTW